MSSLADLGLKACGPTDDEIPFVLDAWCKSYRESPWAGTVANDKYHEVQRWTINSLIARGAGILLAVPLDPAMPRRVVGFVSYEKPNLMHYVYVKKAYRRKGVAAGLIAAVESLTGQSLSRLTHRTHGSKSLLDAGFRWDPTPARTKDNRGA